MKKLFLLLLLVFCAFSLASCRTHYCDYCGEKASWKAEEYVLGLEPSDLEDPVYVCSDCKRLGYGPVAFPGNTIKWTRI